MKFYETYIQKVGPKQVFVFGSNPHGFHGAGSAGFASFGRVGNFWREEGYGTRPHGWQGLYNVKGVGEGFQMGTDGWSYAIPTVAKAGAKRSRSPEDIIASIKSFYAFAISKSNWNFFVAQDDKKGLNGYESEEMARMFKCMKIPDNVFFYKPFYERITSIVVRKDQSWSD